MKRSIEMTTAKRTLINLSVPCDSIGMGSRADKERHSMTRITRYGSAALLSIFLFPAPASAQPLPPLSTCNTPPMAAFCNAVRGDRSEGWPVQSRAEVMAPHGIVATSQPLAAQAGLRILMQGGNAIDAAVATAAVLNVVEPMMVGVGGDLFTLIYSAREHKLFVLNASGIAPTGAPLAHFNELGYRA